MDKNQFLQKLSEDLDSKQIYDEYRDNLEKLSSANVRLGVIGQPNTGKTTLINSLIGLDLPVSNLPSGTCYLIKHGTETKSEGNYIITNNDWIKEHNLSVEEMSLDIVPDETSVLDLCSFVSRCDACIYLLNAQAALNRTDMFLLNNLKDIHMPVSVVLSRVDLLSESEINEVYSYLESNFVGLDNVRIVKVSGNIKDSSSEIRNGMNAILKAFDYSVVRKNFENFYFTIAIGKLYEICQSRIDECEEKKKGIEKAASDKLIKLEEKSTQWLVVESSLREKILSITDKLRVFLSDRKEDMLRRLSHDVDVCGDVKLFWEKDFPFRLEEMIRSEMGTATQLVNQELIKVIQWLQDELLKQFRSKISLTTGIVSDKSKSLIHNSDDVNVTDLQKLKIVTRIGTAATVIAAGALFATSGIGGIIMAVSMVSGLGAEFFMRRQTNEAREEIKKHLPNIVERANLQIVTDYDAKIQEVTAELVSHIETLKNDWLESSKKTIDQEKAIALFNFGSTKWDSIMNRINQISELLIK